ncbi:MAG: DUF3365 domain-containing protein [bacterium]|nr:DUF3365 domain-containing protein [bacterium]
MKKIFAGLMCTFFTLHATLAYGSDQDKLTKEARTVMKGVGKQLKTTLVSAMKKGGPVNALGVCNTKAGPITMRNARETGWDIGRTSLKLRNPSNGADAWELAVLKDFEAKKAAGANPKKLEYSAIIEKDGKKIFRYMKAIPTAAPCLHCHGKQIQAPVKEKIAAHYPSDKAIGFKRGDIRGAFSVSKELK